MTSNRPSGIYCAGNRKSTRLNGSISREENDITLSPNPKKKPEGKLAEAIDNAFGSFDKFREEFTKAAVGQFGSGWAWLVADKDGKLSIETTSNAKNPLSEGKKAIMTADVWEHAYYIDYRNARADGVKAALDRTDWKVVEERYAK